MTQNSRDNTNFPLELARRLAAIKWPTTFDFLYYHQNIARVYFEDTSTRGLLIYHGTGMGKSILAASLAMDALFPREGAQSRRVIILLAKSLASNMRDAIAQYIETRVARGGTEALGAFGAIAALPADSRDDWIRRTFSFVTMNASNMLAQMSRATFISEDDEDLLFDTKAGELTANIANLDNKLLIVDEAHNFFRAIVNGSRNSAKLYDVIMGARNLKIAFLTGTPIASHPFELSVCFNMLAGSRVLPIQFEDFARAFISAHTIKNREKFQNRIFGLVSYVNYASTPGLGTVDILASVRASERALDVQQATAEETAFERAKQHVEFPEEYPLRVIRVPMTPEQYDAYIVAREREHSEGIAKAARGGATIGSAIKVVIKAPQKFRARETPALQKPKSDFSSSYRVHSRQIGNYCPPLAVRRQMVQEKDDVNVPVSAILGTIGTIESAKFAAILARLNEHRAQLGVIYSQFVGIGGLAALARFLDQNGYRDNYAIFSGEIPAEERTRIIERFSDPQNMHADKLALLLISATGAEGIDLKNVRHVHILEPYWNFGRIKQVKARAVRNGSHVDLPPNERNVAIYMYVAVAPADSTETTSDEELYASARESQLLIDSFESAIREVSIECAINHAPADRATHCRICAPTSAPLFVANDFDGDLRASDPCTPITSRRVTAQKITIGSEVFYYRAAKPGSMEERVFGYEIFMEDPRLHAWRKLALNDVRYAAIVAAIARD
jgi:superfamily II DNA or RNA helicase